MSEHIGISDRQVRKYVKRLMELNMITREGGRKNGEWKIIDEEYEGTKYYPKGFNYYPKDYPKGFRYYPKGFRYYPKDYPRG